jgi:hypothetical protein
MTATQRVRTTSPSRPLTEVGVLVAGAVVAVAANTAIAFSALAAGASSSFAPLSLPVFAGFTVVGLIAAFFGWRIIRSRSANPARTLSIVVPVLVVLSYIPDVALLALGFIPGSSLTGVVALALMHLVVVGVAVPICLRLVPVR